MGGQLMRYTCRGCGAEYEGYAEYCNLCGSTDFERPEVSPPRPTPLRANPSALVLQGTAWLLFVLYVVAVRRERDGVDLVALWAVASGAGLALGLLSRHLLGGLLFSALGAAFLALAWLILGR